MYTYITSQLVNSSASQAVNVTRGVQRSCLLSPLLFVLGINPFLRRPATCASVRVFLLPAGVDHSAYSDIRLTFILRNEESWATAPRSFNVYADVSGVALNQLESVARSFGALPRANELHGIRISNEVSVLDVPCFH